MSSYFRRTTILFISVLLICSSVITNADDDKPFIFLNTASYIYDLGINTTQATFAQIARKVGFRIEHGVQSNLHEGFLDDVDVLILFEPNFPIVGENLVALRQWIRNGGILLAFGWNYNKLNGLMSEFGAEFGKPYSSSNNLVVPAGSPLAGPRAFKKIWNYASNPITILDNTKSEAILKYEDGKIAITRTLRNTGKGEIIALACAWLIGDYANIKDFDNAKLVENLLIYIYSIIKGDTTTDDSLDLNLYKLKTKGGSLFLPGDDIKFVAKIKNIGTMVGEETRVAFYLQRLGSAPSAKIEITSATVPAIKAKKKIKIAKKAFLPDDLAPGNYEVTAVIDPEGVTDDANTGNNSATAKKQIVVQ